MANKFPKYKPDEVEKHKKMFDTDIISVKQIYEYVRDSELVTSAIRNEMIRANKLTQTQIRTIIYEIFQCMFNAAVNLQKIHIPNFGMFEVREYDNKRCYNPLTKEIMYTDVKTLRFKPADCLRDAIKVAHKRKYDGKMIHSIQNEYTTPERFNDIISKQKTFK